MACSTKSPMCADPLRPIDSIDRESAALRTAGALRCLVDLASDQTGTLCVEPDRLAWLLSLIADEADRAAA